MDARLTFGSRKSFLFSFLLLIFVVSNLSTLNGSYASNDHNPRIIKTIPVGNTPQFLVYNPSNKLVYAANYDDANTARGTVSVINGTKVVANVTVGVNPYGLVYDASDHEVYVANSNPSSNVGRSVSVIRGTKVVATLLKGFEAEFLIYDPLNKLVYVDSIEYTNSVAVINGTAVVALINVTYGAGINMVFDPLNNEVYVAHTNGSMNAGYLSAIKGTKIVANIPITVSNNGIFWNSLSYDPSNNCIYTLDGTNSVPVVNATTNSFLGSMKTGDHSPLGIGYDPANKELLVTTNDSMLFINSSTNRIVAAFRIAQDSNFVSSFAYDPSNQEIFVTLFDSVGVITSGNKLVANVMLPPLPPMTITWDEVVYNPSNSHVYLSNYQNNSISIIST
jgi:YVTN family beta-propeller protein